MSALETLASADLRRVVVIYRDALRSHQEELNRLNVYPVPDGDTGTNMALTLESVVGELDSADGMAEVCRAVSHGSLMGARGNSGVILSQILRGLADTFTNLDGASGRDLVAGMRRATDAAYQAVLRPVEGTILTVVRAATEAVEAAHQEGEESLPVLLERAGAAARGAVEQTPELLPVLKEAGVVDAGGRGFALMIDAFLNVVEDRPLPEPEVVATPPAVEAHLQRQEGSSLRYEVMYLLEAKDVTISAFKDTWAALGDSIVVVGGDGMWNCHVHTNEVGAAIEAGIDAGRPHNIRVTDLQDQVEEEQWVREQASTGSAGASAVAAPPAQESCTTAVVAVGVGEGVRRLLNSLGVQQIVAGGQSMNPSTAQILEAVESSPSDTVIVLPNNKNIVPVAEQVDGLTERRVEVVPTQAVMEALAALVAYDPQARIDSNVAAMTEAAQRVRTGEVTQAVRDGVGDSGPIAAGDWIGVSRDGIRVVEKTAAGAAIGLVNQLVDDDSELVTVVVGAHAPSADTARIEEQVALAHPNLEVEVHEGDQPLYLYLVGVE
ncbi:MAG TPA: DAK2 domain-containing protein [Acidimicrobiia bacterium]|nr:DAK2 domain-containing protein [Acidimicrobiia bacterium]